MMTISASNVHDMFLDVADKEDNIPNNNGNLTIKQFKFIENANKETTLIVWEILEIKRSFILRC